MFSNKLIQKIFWYMHLIWIIFLSMYFKLRFCHAWIIESISLSLSDGISHTVEILDTAGSHHFPAMRELSIRSGRGFLLVYSIDSLQSFREAVQLWELIIGLRGACIVIMVTKRALFRFSNTHALSLTVCQHSQTW